MVMGLKSATHDQLMSLLSTGCWGSLLHLTVLSHLHGGVVQRPSGLNHSLPPVLPCGTIAQSHSKMDD